MYFDCIVDVRIIPVFNGTPEEVLEYVKSNQPLPMGHQVYLGKLNKMVSVEEYVENFDKLH